jgi:hypothetical protein
MVTSVRSGSDLMARLQSGAPLQRLPAHITDFLKRSGGRHALARSKAESTALEAARAAVDSLDQRIYQREGLAERLRVDVDIATRGSGGQIPVPEVELTAAGPFRRPTNSVTARTAQSGEVDRASQELAEVTEALAALQSERAEHQALANALGQRLGACKRFLGSNMAGNSLVFFDLPAVDRLSLQDARLRVDQARGESRSAEDAPRTVAEVRGLIEQAIDQMQSPASARLLFDRSEPGLYVPLVDLDSQGNRSLPHAWGILAWLLRDELVARLCEDAERIARDLPPGLSEADRTDRLNKCRLALFESELAEEAVCWRALTAGERISLRGDADPAAIMACRRQ